MRNVKSRGVIVYSGSYFIQQMAYYGMRSMLVLYMLDENFLNLPHEKVIETYKIFSLSLIFSPLLGGLLGDLFLGNRRVLLAGGLLQVIGMILLVIPNEYSLYTGLIFIVLGIGLYMPNLMAQYGKELMLKPGSLDTGFVLMYTLVNLGAFSSTFFLVGFGENYTMAFVLSSLLMFLAFGLIRWGESNVVTKDNTLKPADHKGANYVLFALLSIGLFWGVYEITGSKLLMLQMQTELIIANFPESFWVHLSLFFTLVFSVITIFLWLFYPNRQILKMAIGFLLAGIAFALFLAISNSPSDLKDGIYIIGLVLLSAAEVFIAPIVNSVITRYSNPKFLATIFSLTYLPTRLFLVMYGFSLQYFGIENVEVFSLGLYVLLFLGFVLLTLSFIAGNNLKEKELSD
ncbi:MAG: hypothetical protein OEY34_07640 [Cyclobacteriaceae bacterium]|nr:hypothetical protein [Cyclobacteriaceae bacterium]